MKNNRKIEYRILMEDESNPDKPYETFRKGLFHRWGASHEMLQLPFENGEPMWTYIPRTVAIIEDLDTGDIKELLPEAIKFT